MNLQRNDEDRLAPAPGPEQVTRMAEDGSEERSETAGRARHSVRPRLIDIGNDDSGLLFINIDNSMTGALRVCGETFQCNARPLIGARGKTYWAISGKGDRGDAARGLLFNESGGTTRAGKLRPKLTGHLITVAGRVPRRIAGWVRATEATQFYGLKLTTQPDPEEMPELPFGDPQTPSTTFG